MDISIALRPPNNVIWNLFLALIPVVLAFVTARGIRKERSHEKPVRWWLWLPVLAVWLSFLPNTAYLITEWRHYMSTMTTTSVFEQARHNKHAMLQLLTITVFYVLYSGIGLFAFFLSIWPLDRLLRRRVGRWALPGQALFFVLCALGVYLGLINRYNTWDLVHPAKLPQIIHSALSALHSPLIGTAIFGFGVVLWVMYASFDIWMDGVLWRVRTRRAKAPKLSVPEETPHASV